jgi:hypothetical protein
MSEIAPMVQKFVLFTTIPSNKAIKNTPNKRAICADENDSNSIFCISYNFAVIDNNNFQESF